MARPDWTVRVPPHYSTSLTRVACGGIGSCSNPHREFFTLVAHAAHHDDTTDAIRSFSDAIYDCRPQLVSWKRIIMAADWGMEFDPLPNPEPPCGTLDEQERRLREMASRWLTRRDFESNAPQRFSWRAAKAMF